MRIGVLALQGAFIEHIDILQRLGVEAVPVRLPAELDGLDGLIIPGGESTTMLKLMEREGLEDAIRGFHARGGAVFGTCAGLILLAREVTEPDQRSLGLLDLRAERNAFGRQIDSFEADLDVSGVAGGPMRAVFIRAPVVERAGENVDVVATFDGAPVVCRQGSVLVSSFHPELTGDDRLHQLFLSEFVTN